MPRVARSRGQQGQSVLEMAFALPILLLILAAVIDFARAYDAYIVLTNAAREGARFSSRDPSLSTDKIQTLVATDVTESGTNVTMMSDFASDDVTVEIGWRTVTVTVSYDFGLLFGGFVGLDTVRLEKQAAMPIMLDR
jgi:Flp pilus assembly protein TadG